MQSALDAGRIRADRACGSVELSIKAVRFGGAAAKTNGKRGSSTLLQANPSRRGSDRVRFVNYWNRDGLQQPDLAIDLLLTDLVMP